MALNTFDPPVRQGPGTQIKPTMKIKKAPFGDGYTQEMPDGLNHIRDVAELNWPILTEEQASTIDAFFRTQKGTIPFYYAVTLGHTQKWTCKEWTWAKDDANSVTATFEQSFSLEM